MTNNWIKPDWPAPVGIKAASTLRIGGVSTGIYDSWNLGAHVDDCPEHVAENRLILQQKINLPSEPKWLHQVHGCTAVEADTIALNARADASFSHAVNTVCVVMTADCLPLLLCSQQGTSIAAVHGGWRGLLAGVIEQTVVTMAADNLMAWMGPAIGPQTFVVGSEVRQLFIDKDLAYGQAFYYQSENQWLADIYQVARISLSNVGINQIYGGDRCTYNESEYFFSYRRQGETGRMATLIWRESVIQ